MTADRCAQIARALDEPMAGTAPSTRRWMCLERAEPWPSDINQDDDPAVRALLARATAAGFRPLLVRATEPRPAGSPPRVFLADTVPGGSVTTVLTADQLAALPLPAVGHPLPGERVDRPLLLVCAHEGRDPCCGLDGRALLDEVAGPDVFACSHLGGHRFAPTALVLPSGYVYGRLDPGAARGILSRAAHEVVTARCRGRCTWSPPGQVAELAVRIATRVGHPDELVVTDEGEDTVRLVTAYGEQWVVDLERADTDALRPVSCGARLTVMMPLRAAAVRPGPP